MFDTLAWSAVLVERVNDALAELHDHHAHHEAAFVRTVLDLHPTLSTLPDVFLDVLASYTHDGIQVVLTE